LLKTRAALRNGLRKLGKCHLDFTLRSADNGDTQGRGARISPCQHYRQRCV
jgi:hypothetical protein